MDKWPKPTMDQTWEYNYLYNGQIRTSCRTRTSSPSRSSSSTSRPTDQSNYSEGPETSSDPVTTRSDKPACGKPMLIDPDKPVTGNRESAHKKDEMDKEDPTQGMSEWFQPFTDNLEDLETHVPAHSSERENSDSEGCCKSGDTKKEAQYLYSLPQRPRLRRGNCGVGRVGAAIIAISSLSPEGAPPSSLPPPLHPHTHPPTHLHHHHQVPSFIPTLLPLLLHLSQSFVRCGCNCVYGQFHCWLCAQWFGCFVRQIIFLNHRKSQK